MIKEIATCAMASLLIASGSFLFRDSLINTFIVPSVVEQLESKGYLNDDLKSGRYVSTNKNAFNSNHTVDSEILIHLKNKEYALQSNLDAVKEDIELQSKVTQGRTQNKITKLSGDLKLIESKYKRLKSSIKLLEAKLEGKLAIEIYYHKDPSYKGKIRLNSKNLVISDLVSNGEKYNIRSGKNNYEYKVVLEALKVDGHFTGRAVANLYFDDHHQLFQNTKSDGVGSAEIEFR